MKKILFFFVFFAYTIIGIYAQNKSNIKLPRLGDVSKNIVLSDKALKEIYTPYVERDLYSYGHGGYTISFCTNKSKNSFWGHLSYEVLTSNTGKELRPWDGRLKKGDYFYLTVYQRKLDYNDNDFVNWHSWLLPYDIKWGEDVHILKIQVEYCQYDAGHVASKSSYHKTKPTYHYYFKLPDELQRGRLFVIGTLRYPTKTGTYKDISGWELGSSFGHDVYHYLDILYDYKYKKDYTEKKKKTDPTYGLTGNEDESFLHPNCTLVKISGGYAGENNIFINGVDTGRGMLEDYFTPGRYEIKLERGEDVKIIEINENSNSKPIRIRLN